MHRTLILAFALGLFTSHAVLAAPGSQANHPANGSWFGRAIQICADANAPNCLTLTLLMSATLTPDGKILADDFWSFGPHTAAHGEWVVANKTDITADYLTVGRATASSPELVNLLRLRWQTHVLDEQTMIGYVNVYPLPPILQTWEVLSTSEFPVLSADELQPTYQTFVTDPTTCTEPNCPLVFKLTLKRVTMTSR